MSDIIGIVTAGNVDNNLIEDMIRHYNDPNDAHRIIPNSMMRILLPRPMPVPAATYSSAIGKYCTEIFFNMGHELIQVVNAKKKDLGMEKVMLVTNVPLFSYTANCGIFGEAETLGSVALMSVHDFLKSEDSDAIASRTLKEACYLTGVLYGLRTCLDPSCVMHKSKDLLELDNKGLALCGNCREKQEGLQEKAGRGPGG